MELVNNTGRIVFRNEEIKRFNNINDDIILPIRRELITAHGRRLHSQRSRGVVVTVMHICLVTIAEAVYLKTKDEVEEGTLKPYMTTTKNMNDEFLLGTGVSNILHGISV